VCVCAEVARQQKEDLSKGKEPNCGLRCEV
jgi:hypothetical protein